MIPTTKTPSILTGCPGLRHSPMEQAPAYFIVHLSWKWSWSSLTMVATVFSR
jgi:hypothetical protein